MLHEGDAVGQHTVLVQDELRRRGVLSEIFVEKQDPATASRTRRAEDYEATEHPEDLLVYQFATASPLARWLAARSQRVAVNYHNVTPPELVAAWDNPLARAQLRAQGELGVLARRAELGVAVSEYNRADLVRAGFTSTEVIPPALRHRTWAAGLSSDGGVESDEPSARRTSSAPRRWICVGRVAPNKAFEVAIDALFFYRAKIDPEAQLVVVGAPAVESYIRALGTHGSRLGLADAVHFVGKVSDEALRAEYDDADVLVVTSQHEGFCVPLVEAMARGVPVVACSGGAIAEVLGDGGVLLADRDPLSIRDAVARLGADSHRRQVVTAGRARLATLALDSAAARLADLLLSTLARQPLSASSTATG